MRSKKIILIFILSVIAAGYSAQGHTNPAKNGIEVEQYEMRGDTFRVLSGDWFLYYPFGVRKTASELASVYPFISRQQLQNNDTPLDNLYFRNSSIVTATMSDEEDLQPAATGKVEIVYVKIADPEIALANGIRVGMKRVDFFEYLPVNLAQSDQGRVKVVLLESLLLGVWNYYYLSDRLDSIVFKTDYQFDLSGMK